MKRKRIIVLAMAMVLASAGTICGKAEMEAAALEQTDPSEEAYALYEQAVSEGNYEKAMEYLMESADLGSTKAIMTVGLNYMEGNCVEQDYEKALEWLVKSTEAGDRKGPRYVGLIYENGYGTPVDHGKAAVYYQIGASRGDITSQYYLGRLYEYGLGVEQDYGKAMEWYQKAAERGDLVSAGGMVGIAGLYEHGKGVTQDTEQADYWYQKAIDAGYQAETVSPRQVTAITEVFGNGQRITAVALGFSQPIQNCSVYRDSFFVEGRTILRAYTNDGLVLAEDGAGSDGCWVILELDPSEEAASVYEGGIVNGGNGPTGSTGSGILKSVYTKVMQEKALLSADKDPSGEKLLMTDGAFHTNTAVINRVADDFIQKTYLDPVTGVSLDYNLYIPGDLQEGSSYPLVLFMADASADGDDVMFTLRQGNGATVWAEPEEQDKHPSFVLAPQFPVDAPETINDTVIRLLEQLLQEYPIDADRIYTTGQSAGCIRSIDMNIRYRDVFAGLFLVAGQADPEEMRVMGGDNIWIIVSEGDKRGYPGMNASVGTWEADGVSVSRAVWDARWTPEEFAAGVAAMRAEGNTIHYSCLALGTSWDGNPDQESPNEHNSSMHVAYNIEGVRDWLFDQVRGERHP